MHDTVLLPLAVLLLFAKLGGELFERVLKQPAVLGELLFGALLGPGAVGFIPVENQALVQIAELGAVLLLFEVGLESDLDELLRVGFAACAVAVLGVVLPFGFGYLVSKALGHATIQSIFVGAALTATSVGITARVFSDLKALHTREAKIVLGAAVVDDVIGLIILAGIAALASTKTVSWLNLTRISVAAVMFLVGAIVLGLKATPLILRWAMKMQTRAAISCAAIILCFAASAAAQSVQLAPIVGAFASGLVLAKAEHKIHFEDKIKSVGDLLIPLFFGMMGARIDLHTLDPRSPAGRGTIVIALVLFVVAVVGKVLAGLLAPVGGARRLVVGLAMIPRGEVGLIFASVGLATKVIDASLYSAILFVVILTTLVTPPLLKAILPKSTRPNISPDDFKDELLPNEIDEALMTRIAQGA
jgi:Kef-type K+ transport system membrane component KefB